MAMGGFEAAISVALFLEYEDVLTRPERLSQFHGLTHEDIIEFLADFATLSYQAHPVYYQYRPTLPDEGDELRPHLVRANNSEVPQ